MRSGTSGNKFKANRSSWLGGLFSRRKACHDDARHTAASDDKLAHTKSGSAQVWRGKPRARAPAAGQGTHAAPSDVYRAKLSNTLNIIRPGHTNAVRIIQPAPTSAPAASSPTPTPPPPLPTLAPLNLKKSALQLRRERRRAAADKTQSWAGSTAHTAAAADRDRSEASLPEAGGFALGSPRASSLHRRRSLKQAGNLQHALHQEWSGDTCLDLSKADSPLWGFGGFVLPGRAAAAGGAAHDAPSLSPSVPQASAESGSAAREDNSDLGGFSLRFDSLLSPMPPMSPVADYHSLMSPASPTSCSGEADYLGGFAPVLQMASCC